MYENIKVFLTDGESPIGNHLAIELLNIPWIDLTVNYADGNIVSAFDNCQNINMLNKNDVKFYCLSYPPDIIINTFDMSNPEECEAQKKESRDANERVVNNLISICNVIESKLITFSTDMIYDGKKGLYSEDSPANPQTQYGKTKLSAENALYVSSIDYCVIRLPLYYGSVSSFTSSKGLFHYILTNLKQGKEIEVADNHFTNPIYIMDIIFAIQKIMFSKKSGVYNLGGPDYLSHYEIANLIAEYNQYDKSLIKINNKPNRFYLEKGGLSNLKAKSDLNINFTSFSVGLEATRFLADNMFKIELTNEHD